MELGRGGLGPRPFLGGFCDAPCECCLGGSPFDSPLSVYRGHRAAIASDRAAGPSPTALIAETSNR